MDLLHAQFNNGRLSLEEIKICLGSDFGTSWPTLQKKFKQDENGLFFNERLEVEKQKRQQFTASRRKNLTPKDHTEPHMNTHMDAHMENENENIDDIDNNFIMVSNQKIINPLPILEFYEAQLNGTMRENGNIAWKPLVSVWKLEHIGEDFNDGQHVKNSFKKFYLKQKKSGAIKQEHDYSKL